MTWMETFAAVVVALGLIGAVLMTFVGMPLAVIYWRDRALRAENNLRAMRGERQIPEPQAIPEAGPDRLQRIAREQFGTERASAEGPSGAEHRGISSRGLERRAAGAGGARPRTWPEPTRAAVRRKERRRARAADRRDRRVGVGTGRSER